MKDVFTKNELVDLEYFIQDMGIKVAHESGDFATTNGCATYYLYLDGFEQRTCLFKPSYFGRNPKGNWIAVDFVIGKNGNCVLGGVRNIDPSVAKNSSNYTDFYKGYVGKYWRFDVPHDFFDYMIESKNSTRKSIKESLNFKKDYAVSVIGTPSWLKPFYWDFDEFRDDLLIASEEEGFTYYITEATTTDYRINLEYNDGFDRRYDIAFRIIPKSNKATAKELNDYLN